MTDYQRTDNRPGLNPGWAYATTSIAIGTTPSGGPHSDDVVQRGFVGGQVAAVSALNGVLELKAGRIGPDPEERDVKA
jgi:hypothetical protein